MKSSTEPPYFEVSVPKLVGPRDFPEGPAPPEILGECFAPFTSRYRGERQRNLPKEKSGGAAREIETRGFALLSNVFKPSEIAALAAEINQVFDEQSRANRAGSGRTPDDDECFRYAMLNHSALSQKATANPKILAAQWCERH